MNIVSISSILKIIGLVAFITCNSCNETEIDNNEHGQPKHINIKPVHNYISDFLKLKYTVETAKFVKTNKIDKSKKTNSTKTDKPNKTNSTKTDKTNKIDKPNKIDKANLTKTDRDELSNYVLWDSIRGEFILEKSIFVPVGFNAYWLGYTEEYVYPTRQQIEEVFIVAKTMGATVIRSHTLGFSGGSKNSLRPTDNNLNNAAWEPIDYAFWMANKYNIKLVIPLIDGYDYFHGSYGEFCKTRGVDKTQFWSNKDVRADFKEYINLWLNHVNQYTGISIKQNPALFLIELGNELGNIRPGVGSTTVPTEDWITDISNWIKSIDKNHLVLNGADESLGQSNDFNINSLDAYSGHFYSKDYSRIDYGTNKSGLVGKPYIIGEYDCHFGEDWFIEIESIKSVKGTIFWNLYPHTNGYKGGDIVPHNDGYTLHYPEDNIELTRISKHFTRMKSRN